MSNLTVKIRIFAVLLVTFVIYIYWMNTFQLSIDEKNYLKIINNNKETVINLDFKFYVLENNSKQWISFTFGESTDDFFSFLPNTTDKNRLSIRLGLKDKELSKGKLILNDKFPISTSEGGFFLLDGDFVSYKISGYINITKITKKGISGNLHIHCSGSEESIGEFREYTGVFTNAFLTIDNRKE